MLLLTREGRTTIIPCLAVAVVAFCQKPKPVKMQVGLSQLYLPGWLHSPFRKGGFVVRALPESRQPKHRRGSCLWSIALRKLSAYYVVVCHGTRQCKALISISPMGGRACPANSGVKSSVWLEAALTKLEFAAEGLREQASIQCCNRNLVLAALKHRRAWHLVQHFHDIWDVILPID